MLLLLSAGRGAVILTLQRQGVTLLILRLRRKPRSGSLPQVSSPCSSAQAAHSRLPRSSIIMMCTAGAEKEGVKLIDGGVNKGSSTSSFDVERQPQEAAEPPPSAWCADVEEPPSVCQAVFSCFICVGAIAFVIVMVTRAAKSTTPSFPSNEELREGLDNVKLLVQQLSAMQQLMQEHMQNLNNITRIIRNAQP